MRSAAARMLWARHLHREGTDRVARTLEGVLKDGLKWSLRRWRGRRAKQPSSRSNAIEAEGNRRRVAGVLILRILGAVGGDCLYHVLRLIRALVSQRPIKRRH